MILTTKGRYAAMAVIEIADSANDEPLSLFTISQRQQISLSYLEQIFAKLKKAGIVKSVKGPGGGYFLGKPREEITVAEIIKAIGEPIKMTRCTKTQKSCVGGTSTKCKTHHLWHGLENKIYEYLNSISLGDICK
jgi:Rrf2 family transcriptional regulator, iron-sulfur cluster assembly transcription factor